jgi:hypothetical protein
MHVEPPKPRWELREKIRSRIFFSLEEAERRIFILCPIPVPAVSSQEVPGSYLVEERYPSLAGRDGVRAS